MLSVPQEKPWQGLLRICLSNAAWLNQSKIFWVAQMDDPRNTKAIVRVNYITGLVELEIERDIDGLQYAAGTQIRLQNFNAFCRAFERI